MLIINKEKRLIKDANKKYGEYYKNNSVILKELLDFLCNKYSQILMWGAGLKGKAFIDQCDHDNKKIDFIIDMDIEKQGKKLLTGHKIVGIDYVKQEDAVILVANINYYSSICFDLINSGYDIKKLRIICIDQYINGKYGIQDIKNNTIWERKKYYD